MNKWWSALTDREILVLTHKMCSAYYQSVSPASDDCGEIAWELEFALSAPGKYDGIMKGYMVFD